MPRTEIGRPPKPPKPAPKPKPTYGSETSFTSTENQQSAGKNKVTKKAKTTTPSQSTTNFGSETAIAPGQQQKAGKYTGHLASARRNAGAGSNPNIDTKAISGPRKVQGGFSGAKAQGGTFKVSGATRKASQPGNAAGAGTKYGGGGSAVTRRSGGTAGDSGNVSSRGDGKAGSGGFFGQRTAPHENVGPPNVFDGTKGTPRPGGGFPSFGSGYRPPPGAFDTGGAGGGGSSGGAANPIAGGASFTNESLEEVLHGAKKKGRAKRTRGSE